jgi:hypothetical protein
LAEYYQFFIFGSGEIDDMVTEELAGAKINELYHET